MAPLNMLLKVQNQRLGHNKQPDEKRGAANDYFKKMDFQYFQSVLLCFSNPKKVAIINDVDEGTDDHQAGQGKCDVRQIRGIARIAAYLHIQRDAELFAQYKTRHN